jgi:cytochrome b6-f complex iron-sulfur subunit
MIVFVVVIPLLLLAVALMLFSSLRRREAARATGTLSAETRKRDRNAPRPASLSEGAISGREVERSAQLARQGGELVPVSEPAPLAPFQPPDPDALGVSRRQFLNRSIVGGFVLGLSGFGAAVLAFLWPSVKGGFGSKISLKLSDVKSEIQKGSGFAYYPEGRMWITPYPAASLEKAKRAYTAPELAGMEAGVVALYQKCVHLGCRVPQCLTSQWFECPCHGSQYNRVGEKKGGPAPRGLDRFAMSVSGGTLTVNTGQIILGPPIGTNTTGQEAEGPHCISGGEH